MLIIMMKELWRLVKESFLEWHEVHSSLLAAAISYYAIFSFVPIFILFVNFIDLMVEVGKFDKEILRQIGFVFSPRVAEAVKSFLPLTREATGRLASIFSFFLLIYISSRVFVHLQTALNIIWKTTQKRGFFRELIRMRLLSIVTVVSFGVFLLLFFLFNTGVHILNARLSQALPYFHSAFFWARISELASTLIFFLFLSVFYRFLPDAKVQWRDVWLGAFLTALAFSFGRTFFGFYLDRIEDLAGFGAAGSFVIILIWIYASTLIFLFGAKFTYVYARRHGSLRDRTPLGVTAPR